MTTLPRSFKTNKNGSTQICDISVEGDTYTVTWGQLGGAMQTKPTQCTGKNIGKSNETTPEQQAIIEANATHLARINKRGYTTSLEAPSEILLPQKVKVYQDHKDKVKLPCIVMVKLNGVNGEYRLEGDNLRLLSRGGKEYPLLAHQTDEAIKLLKKLGLTSINGEIYEHGEWLEDITSRVKRTQPGTENLSFYTFDLPTAGLTDEEVTPILEYIGATGRYITSIRSYIVHSHEEIEEYFTEATEIHGVEGIIIRNIDNRYQYNHRSSDVFKYKKAKDAEFKIIGMELDKDDLPVFTCTDAEATMEFSVKHKGSVAERVLIKHTFEADYLNHWYKVEFEMYSKAGKPLKPVGIGLRACNDKGEPTE